MVEQYTTIQCTTTFTDRDALDQYYKFGTCDFNHIIITPKKKKNLAIRKKEALTAFHSVCV